MKDYRQVVQRVVAAFIAAPGWFTIGIAAQAYATAADKNILYGFLACTAYLSYWCLALTSMVFSIVALKASFKHAWWWVGQTIIADTAMSLGYWGVVTWKEFIAGNIYDYYCHAVAPLLTIIFWVFFITHGSILYKSALVWLGFPLFYTLSIELFGLFTGLYPYHQLNPFYQGRINVFSSVAEIFILTALMSFVLLFIDNCLLLLYKRCS